MGYITTPKYRAEIRTIQLATGERQVVTVAWKGRATEKLLSAYCDALTEGTQPGGVNEHLGITLVGGAKIIEQKTGMTVITWTRPMFEAVV